MTARLMARLTATRFNNGQINGQINGHRIHDYQIDSRTNPSKPTPDYELQTLKQNLQPSLHQKFNLISVLQGLAESNRISRREFENLERLRHNRRGIPPRGISLCYSVKKSKQSLK
jgi:hypothetical protein